MNKPSKDIIASAPGKILWLGGYSVLERPNPGFVTTVSARVHSRARLRDDATVRILAPQFDANIEGSMDLSTGVINMDVPPRLALVKTAAEVASRYTSCIGVRPSGLDIETKSDSAFSININGKRIGKSGLGSSAAVTVATVGAVLSANGVDTMENDSLHKLSQLAHSIVSGKVGSGYDIATAVYGSVVYNRYSPEIIKEFPVKFTNDELKGLIAKKWDYDIEPMQMPRSFLSLVANFVNCSMPTVSSVCKVMELKEKDPDRYWEIINGIAKADKSAIQALKKINNDEDVLDSLSKFIDAFDTGRLLTKRLGELSNCAIEPEDATSLIEDTKKHGAIVVSKLPGSGGKDSLVSLCMDKLSLKKLRDFISLHKELQVLNIMMRNDGFLVGAPV